MNAHEAVMAALHAVPAPVTLDAAQAAGRAATIAAGKRGEEFDAWWQTNGPAIVEALNRYAVNG